MMEPEYNVHFEFKNRSNPKLWYGLNMGQVADILKEWSREWIIEPAELTIAGGLLCYSLFDGVYFLNFILREKNHDDR